MKFEGKPLSSLNKTSKTRKLYKNFLQKTGFCPAIVLPSNTALMACKNSKIDIETFYIESRSKQDQFHAIWICFDQVTSQTSGHAPEKRDSGFVLQKPLKL
ncbi:hypothetical protein DVA67_034245 [Solirubrobacter sp. CPCC 204708]|nr:hypothetical protein [Solirubrobacter deserti]